MTFTTPLFWFFHMLSFSKIKMCTNSFGQIGGFYLSKDNKNIWYGPFLRDCLVRRVYDGPFLKWSTIANYDFLSLASPDHYRKETKLFLVIKIKLSWSNVQFISLHQAKTTKSALFARVCVCICTCVRGVCVHTIFQSLYDSHKLC